jgi:O-acetylserine/cysteine efflux transporter
MLPNTGCEYSLDVNGPPGHGQGVPIRDALLAIGIAIIWGMNFVVIDEGLAGVPPLLFAAIRFSVVVIPAVFLIRRPAVSWRVLATVGLCMSAGQFALLYTALAVGMPAGLASLVLQMQVVLTVLLAALRLHERPTARQIIGVAVGAAGLAVVASGRSAQTPVLGLLLTLGAALAWAGGNVASRRAGVASGLSMTVWAALFAPLPLFALSLLIDGPHQVGTALTHLTVGNLLSTAYTAYLSTLVGYGVWNTLLARHPAALVVPFTLLVPPVGMVTAWLVQGERPGPAEAAGALILLLGVGLTAFSRRAAPPPDELHDREDFVGGSPTESSRSLPVRLSRAPSGRSDGSARPPAVGGEYASGAGLT